MTKVKENEKIVIIKPVACRPRLSNLKSFSEFLSGAINTSPPAAFTETAVAVIRPRTVRFKPANNNNTLEAEIHGSANCHLSKQVPESNITCNVVYKPIAKLVSTTTVPLLANLGDRGITPTKQIVPLSDFHHDVSRQPDQKANAVPENSEDDSKSLLNASSRDRPSYDGHNWRKYGQKQVKGSEYPRSYYKCTFPNCPMKKKVEKTLDGQIAEIVYKGDHNHSRPQPLNQTPPDGNAERPAYEGAGKEVKNHSMNQQDAIVKDHEGRSENKNITESTSNNSQGLSGECEELIEFFEAEGDVAKSKRTKCGDQLVKASTMREASSEPQIIVQNNADSGTVGDGFRWRKYGQKVVKGKTYPRSYYRCTNPDCNVRKYVERTSEEPAAFITTYEGRHNHPMPLKSEASNARTKRTNPKTLKRNGSPIQLQAA